VGIYYDLDNVEKNGHAGESVPGIALLRNRIRQVHLKNDVRLLEEPGRVDWIEALRGLAAAGYLGWLVFESTHAGPQDCIDATRKNIAFVTRHLA
jgi:sugar phosphate isomerase/epimerase